MNNSQNNQNPDLIIFLSYARKLTLKGTLIAAFFLCLLVLGLVLPGIRPGLIMTFILISLLGLFVFGRDYVYRGLLLLITLKRCGLVSKEFTGEAKMHTFLYTVEVNKKNYYCVFPGKQDRRDDLPGFSWKWIDENIKDGNIVRIEAIGRFITDITIIE